jgi:exodeoxyribonuclease V gamma subunit
LRPSEAPAELDARWEIAGFSLAARIRGLSGNRWLRYRFGKLRAKDLLEIWLQHMALCLAAPERAEVESVFVCTDRTLRLKPVADSRAILGVLLGVYRRGLERPLCFFPQTALEYATTLRRSTPDRALGAARNVWEGSDPHPGESADPYYRRCFEAIDPLGGDFAALSRQVFEPLLEHVGIEKAA